jgi:hypothetical protein
MDEGNPKSRQIKILLANHYFIDMGAQLLESVADWLDKL